MEELERKRVNVIYFKPSGEMYRKEEENVTGVYSQEGIVREVLKKVRYTGMDLVIVDGEDGVRPYLIPYLEKVTKRLTGSRGFGGR